MRRWLFVTMLSGMAMPAFASTPGEGSCRNGDFTADNPSFGLAAVNRKVRAHVLKDDDGCPSAEQRCRAGYRLKPGTRVVTGRSTGKYVCAYFASPDGGGSAGWLDWSSLRGLRVDVVPTASSWVGRWSDGGNPTVRITRHQAALKITGKAFWPGPYPVEGIPVHSGNIGGKLIRRGNQAHYKVDDCKIDLTLVGDLLVVADNESCGGTNVRFNGVYRRQSR